MTPTPPTEPNRHDEPIEPSPSQLVQEFIDGLIQEGSNELQIAPYDVARILDRTGAVATDFAMRGNAIDEETMRWLKRQALTAFKGTTKVRLLGRAKRSQAEAAALLGGIAKVGLAMLLAQVTSGTTLNRFTPPQS